MSRAVVNDGHIEIDGKPVHTPGPVIDFAETEDGVVVVISGSVENVGFQNVWCFNFDGKRRWVIDEAPFGDGCNQYVRVAFVDGKLFVDDFSGHEYRLNAASGSVELLDWHK